jgi:Ser/Thr protein kinase RdoA (MazF antagonist)
VIKLYRGADWTPERLAFGLGAQARAAEAGHPVPRLWPALRGGWMAPVPDGGWITVSDFMPGGHVAGGVAEQAVALARLHRTLGEIPLSVGPAIPTGAGERCFQLLEAVQQHGVGDEMDELAVAAASYRLEALDRCGIVAADYAGMTWQVVHGDYYPANLLFGAGGQVTGIVDWDFCGPNWRELEIARAAVEAALTPEGGADPCLVDAFLDAYAAEAPLTPQQRRGGLRLWFNHLLSSLYPHPLRYVPGAELPTGWQALARRRHHMLTLLGDLLT